MHSKNLLCLYPGKRTIRTFSLADRGAAMLADTWMDWALLTTPLVCYWLTRGCWMYSDHCTQFPCGSQFVSVVAAPLHCTGYEPMRQRCVWLG